MFTVFNRGKAVCRTVIPVADMLVDLHNGGAVEVFELMPMAPASRGGDSELKYENCKSCSVSLREQERACTSLLPAPLIVHESLF